MTRLSIPVRVLLLMTLGGVLSIGIASPSYAAIHHGGKTLQQCLNTSDADGDAPGFNPPTCVKSGNGGWVAQFQNQDGAGGGGGIPAGFVVVIILGILGGIGVTIWRVSLARQIASSVGLNPNTATALTLAGSPGLDAAYIAANAGKIASTLHLTSPAAPPAPAAPAAPKRTTAERLAELQQLRNQNLVTPEEYDERRKAIVDDI